MNKFVAAIGVLSLLLASAVAQTPEKMRRMGKDAALGSTLVIDQIDQTLTEVEAFNAKHKQQKPIGALAEAALEPLAEIAGKGSQVALDMLTYANGKRLLRSFVPRAVGKAAAMGNLNAVKLLVNYKESGWLLSSAVFALSEAAANNNPDAVDFLLKVMDDQSASSLWPQASQGLAGAASLGNIKAKEALKKFNLTKK